MTKEIFENPEIEIVHLENDILTASAEVIEDWD